MDGQIDKWTDMCRWMDEQIEDGWINGHICVDGWMNRWKMDG